MDDLQKEWHRVIRDKRLVLSVMILPGLMIFLIYTFIGSAMDNMFEGTTPHVAFGQRSAYVYGVLRTVGNDL
ncbi:MAG: hypothetical protein MZU97_03855 [Bacillus subtilis]|nr:hypothetical protein [Bacillus subtilis]